MSAEIKVSIGDELALIGSALTDRASRRRIVASIRSDEFQDKTNRDLFGIAIEMERRGMDYHEDSVSSVGEELGKFCGYEKLRQITKSYSGPLANIDHHVHKVRLTGLRASTISNLIPELTELARDPATTVDLFTGFARRLVSQTEHIMGRDAHDADVVMNSAREDLVRRIEGRSDWVGWEDEVLDNELAHGLAKGKVSIIGGRPGCGKSTLVVALLRRRAMQGKGTCYITCEATKEEIAHMMASAQLRIPYAKILRRAPDLTVAERASIFMFHNKFAHKGLFEVLEDPFVRLLRRSTGKRSFPGDENDRALDSFEAMVAKTPHPVVILDLVGYALPELDPRLLDRAVQRFKAIAASHRVHIILVHHLRRADAKYGKQTSKPTMDELRSSGAFEQYCDVVMLLHRPRTRTGTYLDHYVAKQKGGHEFAVRYDFMGQYCDVDNTSLIVEKKKPEGEEDVDAL